MNRTRGLTLLAASPLLLASSIAAADHPRMSTLRGDVVAVQPGTVTDDGNTYDHLMIRNHHGRELQLRLGRAGSCTGCFREGDRVRARARRSTETDTWIVGAAKVRRDRSMVQYRFRDGELVRDQSRLRQRLRDGTGDGIGEQAQRRHRHQARENGRTRGRPSSSGSGSRRNGGGRSG